MFSETASITRSFIKNSSILKATTFFEFKKRYAGSLFGMFWIFLYPLMFLGVYLFLYCVVFKIQYLNFNTLDTVIYIFTGLVPYLAFMDVMNSGAVSVKQNMHLIKNVILPIELIPGRIVAIALVTQSVGVLLIAILCLLNGNFSWHLLFLPLAFLLEFLFLLGCILMIAPLGAVLPDTSYFINLLTLLLMFLSPIGFLAVMVPEKLHFILKINPIYYFLEPFRVAFLPNETVNIKILSVSVVMSVGFFVFGTYFFSKFKNFMAEYE